MEPRVIIPEIVGEEHGGRHQGRRPDPRRPQPPAVGVGAMLKALAAGVVLVVAVSAIFLLGLAFMVLFGAVFAAIGLVSLIRGKTGGHASTVVTRSTRTDGPLGSVFLIERYDTRDKSSDSGERPE